MIKLDHVTKYYGKNQGVKDICFMAEKGAVTGLVGHNGCGKSTIMNMITNCLRPTSGRITVDGVCTQQEPMIAKKSIGYLPETPPLYMDMTVEEQLQFACDLKGVHANAQTSEINRVCSELSVTGVKKRVIKNLSKGYKQRVGFAQALVGNPQNLVLDEPTEGLDPQQIREFRELIIRLKEEHTILLSSHILSEISVTCDKVVVISNGEVVADNTIEDLIRADIGQPDWYICADANTTYLQSVLEELPLIDHVQIMRNEEEHQDEIGIFARDHSDIHEEVYYALADKKIVISKMTRAIPKLEDVFLRLTCDNRYKTGE